MTTATHLHPKRKPGFGWLAQLPVRAGVALPAFTVAVNHPTQATLRWA
jgi:hypothetical protein